MLNTAENWTKPDIKVVLDPELVSFSNTMITYNIAIAIGLCVTILQGSWGNIQVNLLDRLIYHSHVNKVTQAEDDTVKSAMLGAPDQENFLYPTSCSVYTKHTQPTAMRNAPK